MSDTTDGYIIRTRRVYEKALNDLNFLYGLLSGLLNNNDLPYNDLPYNEYISVPAKFNNIIQILDECIMNCEYHEHMEEGD